MVLFLTALCCLVVGLLIGWSGVAGFLLPIWFVSFCGFTTTQGLAISFLCFAVSGAIGAWGYARRGEFDRRVGWLLSAGSLVGAVAGAMLNRLLPTDTVKMLLYLVVLLSGISILVRQLAAARGGEGEPKPLRSGLLAPMGLLTGLLCALSGAGGPVVVMPLLVALGVPAKQAVGVALFNSIFIAIPALTVHGTQGGFTGFLVTAAVSAAAHGVGVTLGSATSRLVSQELLKRGVAIFSICFSLYMLIF